MNSSLPTWLSSLLEALGELFGQPAVLTSLAILVWAAAFVGVIVLSEALIYRGWGLYRALRLLIGAAQGAALGCVVSAVLGLRGTTFYVLTALTAITLSYSIWKMAEVGIFLNGASLGVLIAYGFFHDTEFKRIAMPLLGVVSGILAVWSHRTWIMILTAALGSFIQTYIIGVFGAFLGSLWGIGDIGLIALGLVLLILFFVSTVIGYRHQKKRYFGQDG